MDPPTGHSPPSAPETPTSRHRKKQSRLYSPVTKVLDEDDKRLIEAERSVNGYDPL